MVPNYTKLIHSSNMEGVKSPQTSTWKFITPERQTSDQDK